MLYHGSSLEKNGGPNQRDGEQPRNAVMTAFIFILNTHYTIFNNTKN